MEVQVSRARLSDSEQIAETSSEVSKEGTVRELSCAEVDRLVSNQGHYVAVARLAAEMVGYATSSYSWGKLHLLDVAVRPPKRRIGAGRSLVKHLLDHASEIGLPEAYCEVKAGNIPALNLFTGLGFKFRSFFFIEGGLFGLYYPVEH